MKHNACPDCGATDFVVRSTGTTAICTPCNGYFRLQNVPDSIRLSTETKTGQAFWADGSVAPVSALPATAHSTRKITA